MPGTVQEIQQAGRLLFEMHLVDYSSGNISVRHNDTYYVTRSATRLGLLKPQDIVSFAVDEREPAGVTTEWVVHKSVLMSNPEFGAVVHTHPAHANAWAFGHDFIRPIDIEGGLYTGPVPVIVVNPASASPQLATAVTEALKLHKAVLVRGHGLFAAAATLHDAMNITSAVEQSARLLFLTGQIT